VSILHYGELIAQALREVNREFSEESDTGLSQKVVGCTIRTTHAHTHAHTHTHTHSHSHSLTLSHSLTHSLTQLRTCFRRSLACARALMPRSSSTLIFSASYSTYMGNGQKQADRQTESTTRHTHVRIHLRANTVAHSTLCLSLCHLSFDLSYTLTHSHALIFTHPHTYSSLLSLTLTHSHLSLSPFLSFFFLSRSSNTVPYQPSTGLSGTCCRDRPETRTWAEWERGLSPEALGRQPSPQWAIHTGGRSPSLWCRFSCLVRSLRVVESVVGGWFRVWLVGVVGHRA
jgi:hypothetical protein